MRVVQVLCASASLHLAQCVAGGQILLQPQAHPTEELQVSSKLPSTPLLDLHRALVQIDSTSGDEQAVGDFLVSYLRSRNLTVDTQSIPTESSSTTSPRFNIHAHPKGNRKTKALLTSHIDTVPPYIKYTVRIPSSLDAARNVTKETQIWGRGTVDAKACVASQITAFESLLSSGKVAESDLSLLFVVGEEVGGDGMRTANDLGLTWDAVVFGEPTEGKLAAGHKGMLQFNIEVTGKAAHSGYPWLGQSANDILIAALMGLERLKELPESEGGLSWSEKYGNTTLNIGRLTGGLAANVVAEHAEAKIAIRLAGGTVADATAVVYRTIEEATRPLLKAGKGSLRVVETGMAYPPVDLDTDVDGFDIITVNYGTDVPNLEGEHKRYLYGPGSILVAHSEREHLTVGELEQSVEDYEKIVLAALDIS